MFIDIFLVGLGGSIGSIFRYLISYFLKHNFQFVFPLDTFITNFLGCLFIGYFSESFNFKEIEKRLFFITGFCGGFTTFSTFTLEIFHMLQKKEYVLSSFYILSSIIICIFSFYMGFLLHKLFLNQN